MTEELTERDLADMLRANAGRLDNAAYRHEYERRAFVRLNKFQERLVNSPARFTFGQSGNQVGKSTAAALKASYILTGTPIPNYSGRPIPDPKIDRSYGRVVWAMGGQTGQTAILGIQARLFGDTIAGRIGTGMIPLRSIKKITYAHGVPGLIQDAVIQMDDGRLSVCRIRTYSQGKEALTSEAVDCIIADELPPDLQLWTELIARLTATDGSLLLAATPGRQQSDVVHWFKDNPGPDKLVVRGTLDDAEHITEDQKQRQAELYKQSSEAEYRSRYLGEEYVGGGYLFRFNVADVTEPYDPAYLDIPWRRFISGLDINHGGTSASAHPQGFVQLAYDDDTGICHVFRAKRFKGVDHANMAAAIKSFEVGDAPIAYGSDVGQPFGENETFATMLKRLGLNMLPSPAKFENGSNALEPQITMIQDMLSNGKLRIASHCTDLIEELKGMERDERGKVIDVRDDLVAALRYALMMAKQQARAPADFYHSNGLGRSRPGGNEIAKGVDDGSWDIFTGRPL